MIPCEQHDYIEIACMHRYPLRLHLKSGERLEGIALDTAYDEARRECMRIRIAEVEQLVVLDDIDRIDVSVENPHFSSLKLS